MIVGGLSLLGNNSQNSASETIGNKFYNSNLGKINKENFNTLDEIIKDDSSFYSDKTKSQIYLIKPNLSFKYNRKI